MSANTKPLRLHLAAWVLLPFAAAMNGTLRDFTYGQSMSRVAAHSLSVVPLVVVIVAWAAFLARRRPLRDRRSAVIVGAAWFAMTIAFETTLGLLRGVAVAQIFAEYDLTRGNLWPLVPLATLVAPILAHEVIVPSVRYAARS